MDYDDGARSIRQEALERLGRYVEVILTDHIRKNKSSACIANGIRRGHKGQRRDNGFVSRSQPHRQACQVQCGRPIRHGESVLSTDIGRKFALELLGHRAHGQPSALQYRLDGRDFFGSKVNIRQGNVPAHGIPPSSGKNKERIVSKSWAAFS